MKALWLGFSLLMGLHISATFAAPKEKVRLSSVQRADIESALKKMGENYAKADGSDRRLALGQHKSDLLELGQDLYFGGFMSLQQLKNLERQIDAKSSEVMCTPMDTEACGIHLVNFWKTFYQNSVRYQEPYCVNEGEVATAGACCGDLQKLPYANFGQSSNKAAGEACSDHQECSSKLCEINSGEDGDSGGGACAPVYACYKLIEEGGECSPDKPYCKAPCDPEDGDCKERITCTSVNYNSSGVGECSNVGAQCSSNTECCSDKCEQGKCVPKAVCMDCASMGAKPREGQECCPGTYKGINGTCIQDFPPFTLPENVQVEPKKQNIFQKVFSFIIPSAHARDDVLGMDMMDGGSGGGAGGGGSGTASSGSAECSVGEDGLTNEQRKDYNKCLEDSTHVGTGEGAGDGDDPMLSAMASCDSIKKTALKENKEKGCIERELSRREYRDLYNMPEILSKTYSDVEKCEFNTFNDSWRSKSSLQKNAEIALRAFEYTYSGKGNDMIVSGSPVEPGKSKYWGKNIFGRAQKVTNQLRLNRYELAKQFLDIDIEMTCKCLATFGPSKFSAAKQDFFKESCQAEQAYVTEEEIKNDRNDEVAKEGEVSETTEIDKGAAGITQEKLLIEWLDLRREAQMVHFQNNEELEEELIDLSEFISNYDWLDTPTTELKKHYLYDFYTIYTPGWLKILAAIVIAVVLVAVTIMTFGVGGVVGFAAIGALSTAAAIGAAAAALALSMAIHGMFNGTEFDPTVFDEKVGSGCWKRVLVCVKKYDKYKRYMGWPHFDNHKIASSLEDPENHCKINGHASSCIKSVYLVSQTYSNDAKTIQVNNQPLLDVPLPITVPENAYKVEVTKDNKTYAYLLNKSFTDDGLAGMKATAGKYFKKKGSKYYIKKKHYNDGFKNKLLQDQENLEKFLLENGEWAPEHFNQHKDAFVQGAVDYALCKKLSECIKHSGDLLGASEEQRIKHIGFGYLFEEEEDARLFGEYAYQMHLVWPRIAASERIAYPTLGLDAYFQTMAYNLRLVGSLALNQARETTEMYDLYKADWEKRKADYAGLGGADQGLVSKNVKLGEKFWAEIKTLDFKNPASIEGFSAKLDDYKKSGEYSDAELSAFQSVANHAIRSRNAKKKRAHYDKTVGATERGKQKTKAASKFMAKFNSPLDSMPLNVGGENLGKGGVSNPKPLASVPSPKQAPKESSASDGNKNLSGFKMPDYSSVKGYKAGSNGFSNDIDDASSSLNPGMTDTEAEIMIEAAENDDSLEEALPGDSLWKVVSKAYKRNLSRVLVLKSDIAEKEKEKAAPPKENISDGAKAELKNLLQSN